MSLIQDIIETLRPLVRRERLIATAVDLVSVPSRTGEAGEVSDRLAAMLAAEGFAVERPPGGYDPAPAVAVRLDSGRPGRTLQFDGHLDTVHLPFVRPSAEGDLIRGSGAADMKGGTAAAVEAMRVLRDAKALRGGSVLFTAHDLHESPWGDGRQLDALIRGGHVGDAVLLPEPMSETLPVAGRGQAVWKAAIRRNGPPVHEVARPKDEPSVISAAGALIRALDRSAEALAAQGGDDDPLGPGRPSIFVGQVHAGEIYNQFPQIGRLEGTRRWLPDDDPRAVEAELRALFDAVARSTGTSIDLDWIFTRGAFRLDLGDPFVPLFRGTYEAVAGHPLPLGPKLFVDDGNSFWGLAGVPAITHGPRAGGAHTLGEWVSVDDMERVALLYAATAVCYCGANGDHPLTATTLPDLISDAQTTEERFLRQIFVRDQMAEWSRHPLVMARAEGVHYWDVHGKRYLDALSGIYVVSLGHGNRRVLEAVKRQMDTLCFSPPMHGTNPLAVRLANRLAELAPGDLSAVKLQTGGSEVTEAAIKLARQYHRLSGSPGKYKIISRYLSWHGSTLGSLSASGLKGRRVVNEPLAPGFLHVFPPTCYRCPFGKTYPDCGITCATIVGDVIDMEGPETVAAVMVEPIGHTGGVIDPPDEYLPILREVCDRYNVLLIFDEIITGIGRTGRMFAAETFGVTPDVLCVAKGLGGGVAPVSAMVCRRPIADAFWGPVSENPGFVEGHTFEGNPISCAAALAVLDEIEANDLCGNARVQGERLRNHFEAMAGKYPVIGDVRGKGLFQAVEFVRDRATRERFAPGSELGVKVGRRALENGLLCRFDPHWIAFGPPLVSTAEQIDEMAGILEKSLAEVLDGPAG